MLPEEEEGGQWEYSKPREWWMIGAGSVGTGQGSLGLDIEVLS